MFMKIFKSFFYSDHHRCEVNNYMFPILNLIQSKALNSMSYELIRWRIRCVVGNLHFIECEKLNY